MSATRYSLPAMLLHWAQALLVLWLLWLGWSMVDLPKGAERSAAYSLHKSLGLLVLLLTVTRLAWRWHSPPPPSRQTGWEGRLAHLVHVGLYGFLLLAPLAGLISTLFTPYPLKFFGWPLPKFSTPDEGLNGVFKLLHWGFVYGGAMLIVLHLGGAMKHALLRDGTLSRMLPAHLFRR